MEEHLILDYATNLARERSIDVDVVMSSLEQALSKVVSEKREQTLVVKIDRDSGEVNVVHETEIIKLDFKTFSRIEADKVTRYMGKFLRDATQIIQYEKFGNRIGEITSGIVKRIEFRNIIVDLGTGEAVVPSAYLLPQDRFKIGDKVIASIKNVYKENIRDYQVYLSRTSEIFVRKLFERVVPEISSNELIIKKVVRDPGSRCKISVFSENKDIDPVALCVGMKGNRIQSVIAELQGEKIDVIPWSEDPVAFVINALVPAEVTKVIIDDYSAPKDIEVIVPQNQLSLAIGRKGQNVSLASKLTGLNIQITDEELDKQQKSEMYKKVEGMFSDVLGIEPITARFLINEGFCKIEDIALISTEDLKKLQEINQELLNSFIQKAKDHIAQRSEVVKKEYLARGGNLELFNLLLKYIDLDDMNMWIKPSLMDIKNIADMSNAELREEIGSIDLEVVNAIIMDAREIANG